MPEKQITYYKNAVLNSYAILFFSQNKIFGILLLLASMLNVTAGITGLCCTLFALLIVNLLGFNKETALTGLYSFNSLLLGIGFGTFFTFNPSFWLWLSVACILCIILSINLTAYLGKYGLPILSIPFVIVFWLVLIATNGYDGMGMMLKDSYMIFELYTGSAAHFNQFNEFLQFNIPPFLGLFFRSLSAVIFQNNIIAGLLITIGLLIHSRIALSLLILGFIVSYLLNDLTGTYPEGISNYHLGANFMMIGLAIGGFFFIPSIRSYVWAIIAIGLIFLVVNGMSRILDIYHLPVFSMPFSLLTLALLYFFMLRTNIGKLQLTPIQNYSPETNLYQLVNSQHRLKNFNYLPINLPFMGGWRISQGYNGNITHTGDWAHALDFVITDLDQKTFDFPGQQVSNYYCFNKPVLACADGIVIEVIQNIEDNEIGQVNLSQNWGNTIIIKHLDGLYSKVSHLKKDSAKVKPGDQVKQGDIIALCGNSGRSPEPHLHFQIQTTPYIGAKTLPYPFASYQKVGGRGESELCAFAIPAIGDQIQRTAINLSLKNAFNFEPGYLTNVISNQGQIETWEVFTDPYHQSYLYCKETHAVAYFTKNANAFYFIRFYGDKNSLLGLFFQAAYQINFSGHPVNDVYALDSGSFKPNLWLQDLISPFYIFLRDSYQNTLIENEGQVINSVSAHAGLGKSELSMTAKIIISQGKLTSFEINNINSKQQLKCEIRPV